MQTQLPGEFDHDPAPEAAVSPVPFALFVVACLALALYLAPGFGSGGNPAPSLFVLFVLGAVATARSQNRADARKRRDERIFQAGARAGSDRETTP